MVRENKFFKVPGKPWGFYFKSAGKIDNLKENDFLFTGCGKWSFLSRKGQEKFSATTRIACLLKTYRFLIIFFLWGMERHLMEYFFITLFLFFSFPAKNSWEACAVSSTHLINAEKYRVFSSKKRKKSWLSTLNVGEGRPCFVSNSFVWDCRLHWRDNDIRTLYPYFCRVNILT